jgi:predicted nucleic acid-binding protein
LDERRWPLYIRFLGLEVQTFALGDDEYRRALDLALTRGITVYDPAGVALARAPGTRFVTADWKPAERIAGLDLTDLA